MTYFDNLKLYKWEIPFFLAYILYIGSNILKTTVLGFETESMKFKIIIVTCLMLLLLKEYLKGELRGGALIALTVIVAMMYVVHLTKSFTIGTVLVFLFSSRDIEFKKIAKVTLYLTVIECGLIIILSKAGFITNYIMDEESKRPREFLGFLYALFPAAYLFNILVLLFYVKKDKIGYISLAVIAAVNIWIYRKTDSRLSFYIICLVILSIVVLKVVKRYSKSRLRAPLFGAIIGLCTVFSYIIAAIISIWIHLIYDNKNELMLKLNKLFTNRLAYGHKSIEQYGFSLFGQQIPWYGNGIDYSEQAYTGEKLYVDNLYLQFLQQYGIVLFCVVLVLITIAMFRFLQKRDYYMLFILLILAGHAMVDDAVLHIWINTFWIPAAQVIIRDTFTAIGDLTRNRVEGVPTQG